MKTTKIGERDKDSILADGTSSDLVIAVIGPTGAGKSNFINLLCRPHMEAKVVSLEVGELLSPCMSRLQAIVIFPSSGGGEGRRWVILDTPGLDQTYASETKILRRISDWLALSYKQDMKLTGVLFLYDISQKNILETGCRNFPDFRKLCGDDAPSTVIPCPTGWDKVKIRDGEVRQNEMASKFWGKLVQEESTAPRFRNDSNSAWEIITYILERKMNTAARRIRALDPNLCLLPENQLPLRATDLVIPIMGPAGVGKSTFINHLCGRNVVKIGHTLNACTQIPEPIVVEASSGPFKGRRLIIIDTPSINTSKNNDAETLRHISAWLVSYYECRVRLAGAIYLSTDGNGEDRRVFQRIICGDDALFSVIVGIRSRETDNLVDTVIGNCEPISEDVFWDEPYRDLSAIHQFQGTPTCAWDIVNHLAHHSASSVVLHIQQKPFGVGVSEAPSNWFRTILRLF